MDSDKLFTALENVQKALDENNRLLKIVAQRYEGRNYARNSGSKITITDTSKMILVQDETRYITTIVNTGSSNVYLVLSDHASAAGIGILIVGNGGAISLGKGTDIPYTGFVAAICNTAETTDIVITEVGLEN